MKGRNIATAIFGTILCMLIGTGIASAFSIGLTDTNESGLPDITYATVNGSVIGDGSDFRFEVNLASGLESTLNTGSDPLANFGLDKFFFNTDLTLDASMFKTFDPSTWGIHKLDGSNASGFGKFSIELKDTTSPRPDHLYFNIDYTSAVTEDNFLLLSSGNAGNGNGYFAAKIGGFNYNGIGSTYVSNVGAPIPEPSTLLLLGNGLLGLVFYSRRMRKK